MTSFTEQLRHLDDAGLDTFQFRLLVHYWRVGQCYEKLRTTAANCHMSIGKASETRRWLLDKGWIAWDRIDVHGKTRLAIVLCPPHERGHGSDGSSSELRSTEPRSPHEEEFHANGSPDERRSPPELVRSPHEQKRVVIVQGTNAILNGPLDLNGPLEERNGAQARDGPSPDLKLADMVNQLSEVTGLDGHHFWSLLSSNARDLLDAGYTPPQIQVHFSRDSTDSECWNWFRDDWRGQKGEFPTLKTIWERISGASKWRPEDIKDDWLDGIASFTE
jgi:hypothetical protein